MKRPTRKPGSRFFVSAPLGVGADSVVRSKPDHVTQVKQSFKDECDINKIIELFTKTGQLPPGPPLVFGDARFMQASLHERLMFVRQARERFEALPASIRKLAKTPEGLASLPADKLSEAIAAEVKRLEALTPEARNAAAVAAAVKAAMPPVSPPAGGSGAASGAAGSTTIS